MQRHGNLWPRVTAWENLLLAARRARRGKRYREPVLAFEHRREEELLRLRAELESGEYRPGAYRAFVIREPKRRLISAAPYRDRVVHHALCQVIEPIFERTFTGACFANRAGYGTHRALRRFTALLRTREWVLRGDIRQFFPSIDHALLEETIRRKIKCRRTLALIAAILAAGNEQEPVNPVYLPGDDLVSVAERRRGLPIGNLTSQFFANVFLNPLDHLVLEELRIPGYVRYADDFALFSDDAARLRAARDAIGEHLRRRRLRLHPAKTQVHGTAAGSSFVGFVVRRDRVRVRAEPLRRARRRWRGYAAAFARGEMSAAELGERLQAWKAHLEHADTWRLRERLFGSLRLRRG